MSEADTKIGWLLALGIKTVRPWLHFPQLVSPPTSPNYPTFALIAKRILYTTHFFIQHGSN